MPIVKAPAAAVLNLMENHSKLSCIAIVKDHSDKAYEAFPNYPIRLVDGELLAYTHGTKSGPAQCVIVSQRFISSSSVVCP
ncbi:MAG TPA: hypothetical protein VFS97_13330 [Nitrososphaeraceae archaeon]|nr:hypothetical protein [Nitrososphaeraceae archaeon]